MYNRSIIPQKRPESVLSLRMSEEIHQQSAYYASVKSVKCVSKLFAIDPGIVIRL
jgi:hypothetical protein